MASELTKACAAETAAREALQKHVQDALSRKRDLERELAKASERVRLVRSGLDEGKIALARSVLYLSGHYTSGEQRRAAVQDMIDWLATGEKRTYHTPETGYFGVKNYSGFGDQREDHEYGFGPRHGSIVFAVGLKNPKRELTDEEREAALYYLVNIEAVTNAAEAKVAA